MFLVKTVRILSLSVFLFGVLLALVEDSFWIFNSMVVLGGAGTLWTTMMIRRKNRLQDQINRRLEAVLRDN